MTCHAREKKTTPAEPAQASLLSYSDRTRFRCDGIPGQVRYRRGEGACVDRTAHKARRRTRATTCRGGCHGLAELLFKSLGARGKQAENGWRRAAVAPGPRASNTSAPGGKTVRGIRGGMAHFAASCAIWATETQPVETLLFYIRGPNPTRPMCSPRRNACGASVVESRVCVREKFIDNKIDD